MSRCADPLCARLTKQDIIPALKRQVLAGVHLLFSGVIPLDVEPRRAGIWIAAESFGAVCSTRLEPSTTHVVSAKVRFTLPSRRGS